MTGRGKTRAQRGKPARGSSAPWHVSAFLLSSILSLTPGSLHCKEQAGQRHDGRWAILIAGISGDMELQKEFIGEVRDLHAILSGPMQMRGDHILSLVDDPSLASDLSARKATAENLLNACRQIAAASARDDTVFVFLTGHGSFDGKTYKFNLVGPDLTADDLASEIYSIPARSFVIVNTTTCSGASIEALAQPGKIIITATRSGGEKNRTRLGRYLLEALKDNTADVDRNGRVSIQEAFDYASQKVKAYYTSEGLLQTEHPVLNDGGDGNFARAEYLDPEMIRGDERSSTAGTLGLKADSDALQRQIEALKSAKSGMSEEEYEKELESLLLRLAEITAKLRGKSPQNPER